MSEQPSPRCRRQAGRSFQANTAALTPRTLQRRWTGKSSSAHRRDGTLSSSLWRKSCSPPQDCALAQTRRARSRFSSAANPRRSGGGASRSAPGALSSQRAALKPDPRPDRARRAPAGSTRRTASPQILPTGERLPWKPLVRRAPHGKSRLISSRQATCLAIFWPNNATSRLSLWPPTFRRIRRSSCRILASAWTNGPTCRKPQPLT